MALAGTTQENSAMSRRPEVRELCKQLVGQPGESTARTVLHWVALLVDFVRILASYAYIIQRRLKPAKKANMWFMQDCASSFRHSKASSATNM